MFRIFLIILGFIFISTTIACAQDKNIADSSIEAVKMEVLKNIEFGKLLEQCPVDYYNGKNIDYTISADACSTNPQKCLKKCIDGDANNCFALGYEIQQNGEELTVYTERLYAKSCQLGMPLACTNRSAGILADGLKIKDGANCIAKTFKTTCDLNDQWGCQMYALVLWNGVGETKDPELARKIVAKTCEIDPEHTPCDYAKSILAEIDNAEETPDP